MTLNLINAKFYNPYDTLVKILLVWCVLQDFVLCILLKITGLEPMIKILFYSKDLLLAVLFVISLLRKRLPIKYTIFGFIYFVLIAVQTVVGEGNSLEMTSMLSAIRGLILLPTLTLIGYGIRNEDGFNKFIKKYYLFLLVVALIGLVEFCADIAIGTKNLWMDSLDLDGFYLAIKGASAGLEDGTPGNWYTDIGAGYRSQKRLISIWAAPLTAGFVLLMPCMYYTMDFFKKEKILSTKISKDYVSKVLMFTIFSAALLLTFTRQVLLFYIVFAFFIFVYYRKTNKMVLLTGGIIFSLVGMLILWESLTDYLYNGSTMVHLLRIEMAINEISFWGSGIGSFGTRFEGAIATESHYLTMVGQLGGLSLIPYLVLFLTPIISCLNRVKKLHVENKTFIYSVCLCGIIYVMAGIVSETVDAFTSIAQYYVFVGYVWSYCRSNERCI